MVGSGSRAIDDRPTVREPSLDVDIESPGKKQRLRPTSHPTTDPFSPCHELVTHNEVGQVVPAEAAH